MRTVHHTFQGDLDDLEPPIKRYPVLIETTATYLVWVEDWDELGHDGLIKRERSSGDSYELIEGQQAIDGGWEVLELDHWTYHDAGRSEQCGPWPVCPYPDCKVQAYPAYGVDPTCWKHRVRGCEQRNLPEKMEWP